MVLDLRPALAKVFAPRGTEQVRVADLELAAKTPLTDDILWAYHNAGVFKYNYSLVYDYNPKASLPLAIAPLAPSDLQVAAARIKAERPTVGKAQAVDDIGKRLCALGWQRAAALNAIDVSRYAHLDNGRRTMTINNILRARYKRGQRVIFE